MLAVWAAVTAPLVKLKFIVGVSLAICALAVTAQSDKASTTSRSFENRVIDILQNLSLLPALDPGRLGTPSHRTRWDRFTLKCEEEYRCRSVMRSKLLADNQLPSCESARQTIARG